MSNDAYLDEIDRLRDLPDREFDTVVFKSIKSGTRTQVDIDLMRDPDIVVRYAESIGRLIATNETGLEELEAMDYADPSKIRYRRGMISLLRAELRVVRPLANEESERRAQLSRGRGPRHRAMVELSKRHPKEFADLVAEEKRKDDDRARID